MTDTDTTEIAKFVEENQEVVTWEEGGVRYRLHRIHFTPSGGRWVKQYFSTEDNHWFNTSNQIKDYTEHEAHSLIRTMLEDALRIRDYDVIHRRTFTLVKAGMRRGSCGNIIASGPDPITVLMEAWRKVNDG